jgi:hypothetical protein
MSTVTPDQVDQIATAFTALLDQVVALAPQDHRLEMGVFYFKLAESGLLTYLRQLAQHPQSAPASGSTR